MATTEFKSKRVYLKVKDRRAGLPVSERTLSKFNGRGNQWKITPKQQLFIQYWLESSSPSFGNAYQSAVSAGFSKHYAHKITADSTSVEWIGVARTRLTTLEPEHISMGIQEIAINATDTADKLRALDMLAKVHGMYRKQILRNTEIKFINSVPRPSNEG